MNTDPFEGGVGKKKVGKFWYYAMLLVWLLTPLASVIGAVALFLYGRNWQGVLLVVFAWLMMPRFESRR